MQYLFTPPSLFQEYIPLAMHIADDFFLSYASRDVQLLIACCIADVLRVYAPEAPYKDPGQVKVGGAILCDVLLWCVKVEVN